MSELLDAFQRKHQEKLEQLKRGEANEAFLDGVHLLIADLRQAGAILADPAERGQLRALMRFWASAVYEHTGAYPDTALLPPDPANVRPPAEPVRRPLPPLAWTLVGGAAVIVIVVGLTAVGWLPRLLVEPQETAVVLPTPAPPAIYAWVEVGLGQGGALTTPAEVFCLGVSEISAEFAFEGIQPGTTWHWEVLRDGQVVAAQPAAPWGQEGNRITTRVLGSGAGSVSPGRHDLLVYAAGQVVGVRPFRVLDAAPRALNLRVSDVPRPGGEASREFEAGSRVLYLSYDYEGLCPGTAVSHVLYRQGESIQEMVGMWSGDPRGRTQVSFQAPDDQPFLAGDYEAGVFVAGEEQGRVRFVIGEVAEEVEEVVGPPAFGETTIALSVHPDGTPGLVQETPFGWSTRAVHVIFDYVGMRDGVRWSAVWMRDGTEVATEEHAWDAVANGSEGTYWVTLYNEDGEPLGGGNYTVALYIDGQRQQEASFRIYYQPSE